MIGRDYYGVFPLRGKLLNVRDASHSTIMANKEISELKQILGLQQGKDYTDAAAHKTLRYGHLMIMTDQVRGRGRVRGWVRVRVSYGHLMIMTDQVRGRGRGWVRVRVSYGHLIIMTAYPYPYPYPYP